MIIARFCIELRAENEQEVRRQLRVVRGAIVQVDHDRVYCLAMTAPELSRDDPTSFRAGTYVRPVVTVARRGSMPPARTYWRK